MDIDAGMVRGDLTSPCALCDLECKLAERSRTDVGTMRLS